MYKAGMERCWGSPPIAEDFRSLLRELTIFPVMLCHLEAGMTSSPSGRNQAGRPDFSTNSSACILTEAMSSMFFHQRWMFQHRRPTAELGGSML